MWHAKCLNAACDCLLDRQKMFKYCPNVALDRFEFETPALISVNTLVSHTISNNPNGTNLVSDEKGLSAFMMNLYQDKDVLKDNFLTTGKFSSKGKFPVHKSIKLEHRIPVLVNSQPF
jgi:hypothetical protein